MLLDFDGPRRKRPKHGRSRRSRLANLALAAALAAYGVWGLTLPRGEVYVMSDPAGATVVIDNWFHGQTPSSHRLPLGRHEISVRAGGRAQQDFRVVLGGEPVRIQAKLEPLAAPWLGVGEQ